MVAEGLPGYEPQRRPIAEERDPCSPPIQYGFRSFDRQWIIPDNRLINRPNPKLWEAHSNRQVYLTAPQDRSPTAGPSLTFTAFIPDLHHYNGRGGRVFPLWRDREATVPNIPEGVLSHLGQKYRRTVSAEDLIAYIAAVAAHPAFVARFSSELVQPGLRIPLTANGVTFTTAVDLGRKVVWLHTFGERFSDPRRGRPAQPPRLPQRDAPRIPTSGAIPQVSEAMPDTMDYDEAEGRLLVGQGYVERVTPEMWSYEVSGKQVLRQWFSYRKANRERPIIGDRRPPSKLGEIQPDHWLAEYTTELVNLLNVIGLLIKLEPAQAELLEQVCSGGLIHADELRTAGTPAVPSVPPRRTKATGPQIQQTLFE